MVDLVFYSDNLETNVVYTVANLKGNTGGQLQVMNIQGLSEAEEQLGLDFRLKTYDIPAFIAKATAVNVNLKQVPHNQNDSAETLFTQV